MYLKIVSEKKRLYFLLPNCLLLNRATAAIAIRALQKNAAVKDHAPFLQDKRAFLRIFRELKRAKRLLRGRPLVDVRSADGDCVQIRL